MGWEFTLHSTFCFNLWHVTSRKFIIVLVWAYSEIYFTKWLLLFVIMFSCSCRQPNIGRSTWSVKWRLTIVFYRAVTISFLYPAISHTSETAPSHTVLFSAVNGPYQPKFWHFVVFRHFRSGRCNFDKAQLIIMIRSLKTVCFKPKNWKNAVNQVHDGTLSLLFFPTAYISKVIKINESKLAWQ